MDKKVIGGVIAGVLIVGGVSFYAGTKSAPSRGFAQGQNAAFGQSGQMRGGQFGAQAGSMRTKGGAAGFTAGQVIAKDDTSITVKLSDGGSKIIFLTPSTSITKTASSTISDVAVDSNVIVSGTPNSDGSINAASIQLGADIARGR